MSAYAGSIPPSSLHQVDAGDHLGVARACAVTIAGLMAELGVQGLTIEDDGAAVPLAARGTDLPGEMVKRVSRTGTAVLHADALGVTCTLTHTGASWSCGDRHLAGTLRQMCAKV